MACFAMSLLNSRHTLTWFADIKVHGSPHVEYFLDNGFGQGSGSEQDWSSPLCPLGGDGTVGSQVQTPAQLAVWVSSVCSQPRQRTYQNIRTSIDNSTAFTGYVSTLIRHSLNDSMSICRPSPHTHKLAFQHLFSALSLQHFSADMSICTSNFINCS